MANINTDFNDLTKLKEWWVIQKANLIALNLQLEGHVAGTQDTHAAQVITFNSDRPTITAVDVLTAIEQVDERVEAILQGQSLDPNKDVEVLAARVSSIYGAFVDLPTRLDTVENTVATQLASIELLNTNRYTGTKDVKFIAHRGLSSCAPENTIPAYELAGKAGMWGAECDVQVTSDGIWVLMHDTTVDRTTNGTGNVYDLTLAQIKALVVGGGTAVAKYPNLRVPTLEEYLLTCKKFDIVPVMEIKSQAYTTANYDDLIVLIKKLGFEENAIIISFSYGILQEVRSRSKNIILQFLATLTPGAIDEVLALGNASVDVSAVTKVDVEYAHSRGVMVNVWTVNSYQLAKTYIDFGVDFITTDQIGGVI